jgi:hypothetical protein
MGNFILEVGKIKRTEKDKKPDTEFKLFLKNISTKGSL